MNDFHSEEVDPDIYPINNLIEITKLEKIITAKDIEISELKKAIKRQAAAYRTGLDATLHVSSAQLSEARKIKSECNPVNIESEKDMNDILTRENQELNLENDKLKEALQNLLIAIDSACFGSADYGVLEKAENEARDLLVT